MRSHTGERPFECSICRRKFTLKHSMMRHLKTHGVDAIPVNPSKEEGGSESEEEEGEAGLMEEGEEEEQREAKSLKGKAAGVADDSAGLLNSLLGVDLEDSQLNQMLDSADSAAKMLGM